MILYEHYNTCHGRCFSRHCGWVKGRQVGRDVDRVNPGLISRSDLLSPVLVMRERYRERKNSEMGCLEEKVLASCICKL